MYTRLTIPLLSAAVSLFVVSGCNPQAEGFALPPGDAAKGKSTFIKLECNACHSVKDSTEKLVEHGEPDIHVVLGGDTTRVKTYGDLVTSIINPSHKLSRGTDPATIGSFGNSQMAAYNDRMTVQEMLDLTTFLQDSYTVWVPHYGPYYFP